MLSSYNVHIFTSSLEACCIARVIIEETLKSPKSYKISPLRWISMMYLVQQGAHKVYSKNIQVYCQ